MVDVRTILERGVGEAKPPPDGFDRMLRRRDRKRRAQRLRAGALGIVLTLGVGVAVVTARSANVPVDETPSPRPPLVELGRGIYLVDVSSGEVARMPRSVTSVDGADRYDVSPDGTKLLFEGLDPDGASQVFVADVYGRVVQQLTNDPFGAFLGGWSPDSGEVVYVGAWRDEADISEEVALVVTNVDTGQARSVITGKATNLQQPLFSPDGESILFTRRPFTQRPSDPPDLWSVPVEGGSAAELFLEERGYASFAPDGTAMVLSVPTYSATGLGGPLFPEIWLASADGSDLRLLVREDASDDLFNENAQWSPDGTRILYSDGAVHVVDVLTGESSPIAEGYGYDWLNDDTIIVRGQ